MSLFTDDEMQERKQLAARLRAAGDLAKMAEEQIEAVRERLAESESNARSQIVVLGFASEDLGKARKKASVVASELERGAKS